ncbi:MAG: hypothetical protein IJX09_02305 [Clostridia bacterium]|nr:hypothetical protein [Clostridia bacterium]
MQIELADIVKLYNRIEELEKRVAQLEKQISVEKSSNVSKAERPAFPVECANSKYKGLSEFLYGSWEKRIVLSYEDLERILGFSLPTSAHMFPLSYWANTEYHSYAKSWLALGYKARVDVENKSVTFERNLY